MGQVLRLDHRSLDYQRPASATAVVCVYSYAQVAEDESSCVFK